MRLAPLQAVAQITGRKEQEQLKPIQEIIGPGAGRPVGVPQSLKSSHSPAHPSYPCWLCCATKAPGWGPPRCGWYTHAAGRRCRGLGACCTGAASLQEGQGQGGFWGGCGSRGRGEEVAQGGGANGARVGAAVWGLGHERGGGACLCFSVGPVRGRARRGGEEGDAKSAVLFWGSLTAPRAEPAGTRGRGIPGEGAWHWGVHAPDNVSTLPSGSARALSSGASHPAPSPWVELGSTHCVVLCCVVLCCVVLCCVVLCCVVLCCVVLCCVVLCCVVLCCVVLCCVVLCCGVE